MKQGQKDKKKVDEQQQLWDDTLRMILSDFPPGNRKKTPLKNYVEQQWRETSTESFGKFMKETHRHLFRLVNSSSNHDKITAIRAINELLDVDYDDIGGTHTIQFANYLRSGLTCADANVMVAAADVLGQLVRKQGSLMIECVDFEMKRSLEWLEGERFEASRRHAAVLVLKQMASNAPTSFYFYVNVFFELIWSALRDRPIAIREAAAGALSAALQLTEERTRTDWYGQLWQEVLLGFRTNSVEGIHGSLLALRELLAHTGRFMANKQREVCDSVWKYKDHRDRIIRNLVVDMLPEVASFAQKYFVTNHLADCMNHFFKEVKKDQTRTFLAIGGLSIAVGENTQPYVAQIVQHIKTALTKSIGRKSQIPYCHAAVTCVSMVAKAVRTDFSVHLEELLPLMSCDGISSTLTDAFRDLGTTLPDWLPTIQHRLLDLICYVLGNKPYVPAGAPAVSVMNGERDRMVDKTDDIGPEKITLALNILGEFDFSGHYLLDLVKEFVVRYLDHEVSLIRIEAVATCAKLMARPIMEQIPTLNRSISTIKMERKPIDKSEREVIPAHRPSRSCSSLFYQKNEGIGSHALPDEYPSDEFVSVKGHAGHTISHIVELLLNVAIVDPDPDIRHTVLEHLDHRFDLHLAQAENIRRLFIALNDENFTNREEALRTIARLTSRNPAYCVPSLRNKLMDVLIDLQYSSDGHFKEESGRLLCHIISASGQLIRPNIDYVLKEIVPLLRDPSPRVTACILRAVGEIAKVAGRDISGHMKQLLPLIVDTIQDQSSDAKREAGYQTLGLLLFYSGYVVMPLLKHPKLGEVLVGAVSHEKNIAVRHEVVKVLGLLGAVDPYRSKGLLELSKTAADSKGSEGGVWADASEESQDTEEENEMDLTSLRPSSEDYYPTVAFVSLTNILKDSSLATHHTPVAQALMHVFKSLGLKCTSFLPQVMPHFFHVMRTSEPQRMFLFQQLGVLVPIIKQHIREYLDDILALIREYWDSALILQIITLVEELSFALGYEFKKHLPSLIPQMLLLLQTDKSDLRRITRAVLHALEVIGTNLDGSVHILFPAIIRLCEGTGPIPVRNQALFTMARLCKRVNVTDYASRIIHPLIRVLDSGKSDLHEGAIQALQAVASQLGPDYLALFHPMVQKVMDRRGIVDPGFSALVSRLESKTPSAFSSLSPHTNVIDVGKSGGGGTSVGGSSPGDHGGGEGVGERGDAVGLVGDAGLFLGDATVEEGGGGLEAAGLSKLKVNEVKLLKAWDSIHVSEKEDWRREDWSEWLRKFGVELLRESPSPALRACLQLAQVYHPLARNLFNAAFVSCWSELNEDFQGQLVRSLESALLSENLPTDILQNLLNLAEFMEHHEKPLPIDHKLLGALAEKCQAYAKALHYKELEFRKTHNISDVLESLIAINNKLQQPTAALGVLAYAQEQGDVKLKESWYEKLERWEDALDAYDRSEKEHGETREILIGRMTCLHALGEWHQLGDMVERHWGQLCAYAEIRSQLAPIAAAASWRLGRWASLEKYSDFLDPKTEKSKFYRAVLAIRNGHEDALEKVAMTRSALDTGLPAQMSESVARAYMGMVTAQQLAEMEEVVYYKKLKAAERKMKEEDREVFVSMRQHIHKNWKNRLWGVRQAVQVWDRILMVRSLVLPPHEDVAAWVKMASLCRKNGRMNTSRNVLCNLLMNTRVGHSPDDYSIYQDCHLEIEDLFEYKYKNPALPFAYLKHQWDLGRRHEAFDGLKKFLKILTSKPSAAVPSQKDEADQPPSSKLLARCYLKMGRWQRELLEWSINVNNGELDPDGVTFVSHCFKMAIQYGNKWHKTWHWWALVNYDIASHMDIKKRASKNARAAAASSPSSPSSDPPPPEVPLKVREAEKKEHEKVVLAAMRGFFQCISLGTAASLQDTLRLLTLWFKYTGTFSDLEGVIADGFEIISIETWLTVIPQILARIHSPSFAVRRLILQLLSSVGKKHPQALVYPLTVAAKSQHAGRVSAAMTVIKTMQQHSPQLVTQADLVSAELIRVAILWHERWNEGLEEASRLYFGESNVEGMLETLAPLHQMMDDGPETQSEQQFHQAFVQKLHEAHEWCRKYVRTNKVNDLNQAWDIYYTVFRHINKQLPQMTKLELQSVSPKLLEARDMELAVPGTYAHGKPIIKIKSICPTFKVINSKQRPRKLTMTGSDGKQYAFLLKGHEDLRQDERVMQLFGLVNTLLAHRHRHTSNYNLSINQYAVIPLSPNSGIIGWVQKTDTMHQLIREHREHRKVPLNVEHRLMSQMGPHQQHDKLTLIQKVEVLGYALDSTNGLDLNKILWLKSRNSETWLERRTNYTRSLGVMSMVGYILGLGDRHPSNLMIHRVTGSIIHIDFGDCFEVAMHREKFPEKIPFRLTRMLTNAMEVSGIEGTFRHTCESVMDVLRQSKESLMAVLAAFVYDPLINWRLLSKAPSPKASRKGKVLISKSDDSYDEDSFESYEESFSESMNSPPSYRHSYRLKSYLGMESGGNSFVGGAAGGEGESEMPEELNKKALDVINRVNNKLTGRDFAGEEVLDVKHQVQRLIDSSTSYENLCQCYIGWCPFW